MALHRRSLIEINVTAVRFYIIPFDSFREFKVGRAVNVHREASFEAKA
jgi:hypothetical protein